ncbi:hypothetical protein FEM48_Zijuj08G0107800 [Ziziphus jujuba var. spinosa]|uniref:Uncharacterized protein n=1 Tax=Ziziphus jujuba var. spinosa TaxID=714518 RepID=A0A978UYN0_ZIZJJ|nr:hypothetical protein FEM48_Zijuj08G0107800 [Ziziphus jujuba var. spinosa]
MNKEVRRIRAKPSSYLGVGQNGHDDWSEAKMGRMEFLAMRTDPATADLINSDINELKVAAKRLFNDASKLGGLGFGTSFLKWVASFAAMLDVLFVDIGSNKLENKYAYFTFSSLYLLQSSRSIVQLAERRGGKMDCFHCSCIKAFLPTTFPRLVGDARIIDSSSGRGSELLCTHIEGQLG